MNFEYRWLRKFRLQFIHQLGCVDIADADVLGLRTAISGNFRHQGGIRIWRATTSFNKRTWKCGLRRMPTNISGFIDCYIWASHRPNCVSMTLTGLRTHSAHSWPIKLLPPTRLLGAIKHLRVYSDKWLLAQPPVLWHQPHWSWTARRSFDVHSRCSLILGTTPVQRDNQG